MASYHMQINTGAKGEALGHAHYIQREGSFSEERYGEVAARGHANMPEWARQDTAAFWRASDDYERANGNTYREYELALPRELSPAARVALVERFAEQEFGTTRPYQWAIHRSTARDGKEQPHVHLMFSDRQHDGIERGPEQFFKRYNAKNPERGGARKVSYGADKEEAAQTYEGIRERWANVQNQALEQAGVEARVDHRSLAAQGIHREPEVHRGPAVSGIEARGEVSQVGERQREQLLARSQARAMVVEQVRVVTREEVAAERVAVRERRELAREVTGADRAVVLPLVEADRREQLGRTQAAAERRIERRQGLSMGGQLKEKLLTQARALRERIGQQLGRVKAWVAERFPEPFERLKNVSREVFQAVAEKTRGAREPQPEKGRGLTQAATEQPAPSRGIFAGLNLGAGDTGAPGAFARPGLGSEAATEQSPSPRRAPAVNVALERYARAWQSIEQMRPQGFEVLEHQKVALAQAGAALEAARPGTVRDLGSALRHEPALVQAMTTLSGERRTRVLMAGLAQEERLRANPEARAQRLVKTWQQLEAQHAGSGRRDPQQRAQVEAHLKGLVREMKGDKDLQQVLERGRTRELTLDLGRRLQRVVQEQDLERALSLSVRELGHGLSR